MALRSVNFGSLEGGQIIFSATYDDTTNYLRSYSWVNGSERTVTGHFKQGNKTAELVIGPHTSGTNNVPNNAFTFQPGDEGEILVDFQVWID